MSYSGRHKTTLTIKNLEQDEKIAIQEKLYLSESRFCNRNSFLTSVGLWNCKRLYFSPAVRRTKSYNEKVTIHSNYSELFQFLIVVILSCRHDSLLSCFVELKQLYE